MQRDDPGCLSMCSSIKSINRRIGAKLVVIPLFLCLYVHVNVLELPKGLKIVPV